MENKNLHATHKHLTLVFTTVTFCIILLIGGSFITARYFNESRIQKRDMLREISMVSQGIQNEDNFLQKYASNRNIDGLKKFELGKQNRADKVATRISFFVLDSERNLVFQQRLQEPNFQKLDFESPKIYTDSDTFISVQSIPEGSIIFYQNIRYSLSDSLSDFILLLMLVSVISGGIYFIGYKFVGKALRPVRENMKDMSDFIHNAGHELKTPLAVIRGNLQIMQVEKKLDSELTGKTIHQVDSASKLIEGLQELSQAGKISEKTSINVGLEVKKIFGEFDVLAKQKGVKLRGSFPENSMIYANREELNIVIGNLIKNAICYNKKGGEVSLSMKKNTLTVLDTGIGISKENQKKIFQRLYRGGSVRDTQGFGIGLSLVEKIAKANGWKIELSSKLGEGTKFRITF